MRTIAVQTMESLLARTEEVGECLEWQGYSTKSGTPQVSHDGKMIAVRRLLLKLQGIELKSAMFASCSCGNSRCVRPEHIVRRTQQQHLAKMSNIGPYNPAARIAKSTMKRRQRSRMTMEMAREIRASEKSSQQLAEELGFGRQTISRIRFGQTWKEISSPFAGLGAR